MPTCRGCAYERELRALSFSKLQNYCEVIFVFLPRKKFYCLLLFFLYSERFAMMSKSYSMVHNYFSRTCPSHIQEISQLCLVYSSTSLIVASVTAILFTDALEKWWYSVKISRTLKLYIELEGLFVKKGKKRRKKSHCY